MECVNAESNRETLPLQGEYSKRVIISIGYKVVKNSVNGCTIAQRQFL